MGLHYLVPLLAAVANVLIAALVLRRGVRDHLHLGFAWMTVTFVGWNLDIFALYYFPDPVRAEWWSRVFRTVLCFLPPAAFHFSLIVSQTRRAGIWRWLLRVGYGLAALLAILNLHGDLVRDVVRHPWGWYIRPTPLYAGLTASLVIFPLLWVERVWHMYRKPESPQQRLQAKFWFFGGVIQLLFGLTALPAMYGYSSYPLADFGNVMFVAIIAYAIVRHRLMDLDYVVRKVLSFTLAAVPVLVPGGLGLASLSRYMHSEGPLVIALAGVALALVAVIAVPTLQEALETQLHRALFPERYDARQRLRELSKTLVQILDRGELVKRLGEMLADILNVEGCEVFTRDDRSRQLSLVYPPQGEAAPLPEEAGRWLEGLTESTLVIELEASRSPAKALFQERGWEVGIPLRTNDRLLGFVGLGRNRAFRVFSAEDLQLLSAVGASASVALENARLSQQLRRSESVLERANRLSSVGQLAAGIAHEIRNPLVAVKTFLDLLPERMEDKEFLIRFRELSLGELARVTSLIQDLLSFGKSTKPERRDVVLAEALEPVVRLMETTARKREVELTSRFEPNLPSIMADPDQLKQIVLNLLLNAIEVSPAAAKVRIEVHRTRDFGAARSVVIEVHDQGPGIPKEQQEDIFLPFFTTKETGTGLGLALVHQMVLEHGGEISVDSVVGRGTVFRVTLPVPKERTESPSVRALAHTGT
jgi:signal transduction histidine kinase